MSAEVEAWLDELDDDEREDLVDLAIERMLEERHFEIGMDD